MPNILIQKAVALLAVLLIAGNGLAVAQDDNASCSITPETSISDALGGEGGEEDEGELPV